MQHLFDIFHTVPMFLMWLFGCNMLSTLLVSFLISNQWFLCTNLFGLFSTDGPEIAPGDDSAEVNRGLNVSLTCKADGNPKPVLRWSFNNQPMATGKGEATLTISRAKVTDSGEYLCTAANKIGTQTKRVSLVVKGRTMQLSYWLKCTHGPTFAKQ
uniref:Ig-like domain-containing protein n=1 Tax=Astyanax mexicanus TaxID=7994 RepID=A0A8B9GW66_ASTMX